MANGIAAMSELQDKLYAQHQWGVLLIFQAMDAAGKDGSIKHVMSGVNPQGVEVYSFKTPSAEELDHDYLWRTSLRVPGRGRIGIFNRSYYEEVLVVRVHPEFLKNEKLPPSLVTKDIWKERFRTFIPSSVILPAMELWSASFISIFRKRSRRSDFSSAWIIRRRTGNSSASDVRERAYWKNYMKAYEDMIVNTASKHVWDVIGADDNGLTCVRS